MKKIDLRNDKDLLAECDRIRDAYRATYGDNTALARVLAVKLSDYAECVTRGCEKSIAAKRHAEAIKKFLN